VMFGPPGTIYVYRSYGIHWCMNVVCGPEGSGEALLIRAIEPTHGLAQMRQRRGREDNLCNGPGRLCQALGVDGGLNGAPLGERVTILAAPRRLGVVTGPRIGISKAVGRQWRFGVANSTHLSRPFPAQRKAA
jgi:DNA-3-methyladenine glycosylase